MLIQCTKIHYKKQLKIKLNGQDNLYNKKPFNYQQRIIAFFTLMVFLLAS